MDPLVEAAINGLRQQFDEWRDLFLNHAHRGYDQTKVLPTSRFQLKDAASISANVSLADHFYVTLEGNRTLENPIQPRDGQYIIFEIIQDGTGSRTITLGSKFVAGPFTITLSTTADERDFIECRYSKIDDKFYIVNFTKGY